MMYKRLILLTCFIFIVLAGTAWLGFYAIRLHAAGLEGRRIGQFAAAAENIRREVMRCIDEFVNNEQRRPYTDYQYYYIPEDKDLHQVAVVRSPLAGKLENDLACGYFQIDANSQITTPYRQGLIPQRDYRSDPVSLFVRDLRKRLIPALNESYGVSLGQGGSSQQAVFNNVASLLLSRNAQRHNQVAHKINSHSSQPTDALRQNHQRRTMYEINIIKAPQDVQVYTQQRMNVAANEAYNRDRAQPHRVSTMEYPALDQSESKKLRVDDAEWQREDWPPSALDPYSDSYWQELAALQDRMEYLLDTRLQFILTDRFAPRSASAAQPAVSPDRNSIPSQVASRQVGKEKMENCDCPEEEESSELVTIRQEPFVPLIVSNTNQPDSLFSGQVYLLRHVQVGNDHYLQGFRLNENRLLQIVKQAATQFTAVGPMPMDYQVTRKDIPKADYAAVLDFGFGNLIVNLFEKDPLWIVRQVARMKLWYFAVMAVMSVVVMLGLTSLWRGVHAQVVLANKKDDFISAVSHELRTPLTSLRMYAEMLEKNWVTSDKKRHEYYQSMRQESERLSRLIENVLDFSRIQRQSKKYQFKLGDINSCVKSTVETMRAYAAQTGFELKTRYGDLPPVHFDHDAVVQIVINLIDNAIKYAKSAQDKSIYVKTGMHNGYVLLEIEDRGPGVPHMQRKKIFDEFYRCEDESTRESTGTGLGLALVMRFAKAHNGFVELVSAKPSGALFRVALACENH